MRVFLDANILFSAAKSDGAVRELLRRRLDLGHDCRADDYVVIEARRNLAQFIPRDPWLNSFPRSAGESSGATGADMLNYKGSCTLFAVLTVFTGATSAQDYPVKPIRIITSEAGSGGDFATRLIVQGMPGRQFVVDNRNLVGIEMAAKAPPDGYTLLLHGTPVWLAQFMRDSVPWDTVRDFAPVTLVAQAPNVLAVHPSLPVKSVAGLIALARARPGDLNYGSGPGGAVSHLSAELLKLMTGVNIVRISYRGTGQAMLALLGGQVQVMFAAASASTPHFKAGKLRALAVTSAQPSALLPGLPTVAASGLPGYESILPFGMFAPVKTPAAIIDQLNRETVQALNTPQIKERLSNAGTEAVGSSPEQLAAMMKSEMAKWGKVIRDAGIREE